MKRGRRRRKTASKRINIKGKKKHEVTAIPWFLGQWDRDGLLLPSMCIVMVSICPCVSLLPLSVCLSFCLPRCQSNRQRSHCPLSLSLPPPQIPFFNLSPYTMFFHILECQCATCWHCAWMITCLYIVIENCIPFPCMDKKMVWMLYRFRISVLLLFCSVSFF